MKGKAFDEKADLFSLGMLFYHIISGLFPFDDLNSIKTKVNITTGTRPKFKHIEYAMLPRCAHLEALMRACWQDSPIARPSAKYALNLMQNASFLCLRHYLEVESDNEACLYTQDTATEQDEEAKCDLWLWRKSEQQRLMTAFNFEYKMTDHEKKECLAPGDKVLCAVQFGDYHVLGTSGEKLEIYRYNREKKRLTHQTDLFVLTQKPATSLFYYPMDGEKSDTLLGYLFAGLEDGTLLIYSHNKPQKSTTSVSRTWELRKRLVLSGEPKPCQCMALVNHRRELLIGCGNTVRVLNLNELLLLDPQVLEVGFQDDQMVQGLACYGDMVWCFTEESTYITQYDLSKRTIVDRFYCCSTVVMQGHCLSDQNSESTNMTIILPLSPSSSTESPPFCELSSRPRSATLTAHEARARFASTRTKSRSLGDRYISYNVTALIAVKDTLWIGRSDGVILVIGIDHASERYKFGEVLSVLSPSPMLDLPDGPVSRMFLVASDRVVACRDIVPEEAPIHKLSSDDSSRPIARTRGTTIFSLKPRPYKHQLLVWEDWGSHELRQFKKAHELCNY
ncbi:leucine-rich repeat serine/threonine-protein kinase 1-like [Amphiura filiformis]|uniref:leucine-rich repeat serine/threonine-protein kinase 1-like n=1 Tax=Amphiura filiformis TaxID=82378 RepID=UPI003B221B37